MGQQKKVWASLTDIIQHSILVLTMLELPHTLVGAALASKLPDPYISLPLAFTSHFIVDLIPHWNPSIYRETKKYGKPTTKSTVLIAGDTLLSLISGCIIAFTALPDIKKAVVILMGCFLAVSPDAIEGLYYFMGRRDNFLKHLIEFQRKYQSRASVIPGIITQILIIFFASYVILST